MNVQDLDRLERYAKEQRSKPFMRYCNVHPGELLELVELARFAKKILANPPEPKDFAHFD